MPIAKVITGALAGWKRQSSRHGILLTLQVASTISHHVQRDFAVVNLALNDRQLRSLARDLARASRERGLELFARPSWHQRWLRRLLPFGLVKAGTTGRHSP